VASAPPAPAAASDERGLTVPDVSSAAAKVTGSLGDRSLQDAVLRAAVERWTGLLTLTLDDGRTRYGFWNKGGPVAFRTDPVAEDEVLGVLLFQAGQITKEQLGASLERMKESGQRQGEAFIDMGLMTFSQLIMVLGKQAEFVFSRLLAEVSGTWSFHNLDVLPEQYLPPPARAPSLIYRALLSRARAMPAAELASAHRDNIDQYIKFNAELVPVLADIQFDANERKLLGILRGRTWRMREAFSVSPISRQATACVLWALMEMGFLGFERTEDRERYLRRLTEQVSRKTRQLANCTHFDTLEVHWISLPAEIQSAHQRLLEEYDPAQYEDPPGELIRAMEFVRQRLGEAYAVLSSDDRRRTYRKELLEPMMIRQSAELLSKKGEMAIMRKDRREAMTCFAKALELQPGNPAYREGMQRARTAI
jgi:tetratricopeptide (TPR) repeat protein